MSKLGLSENVCFQGFSLYHRYICETNIVGKNDRVKTNHLVHEAEIQADIIEWYSHKFDDDDDDDDAGLNILMHRMFLHQSTVQSGLIVQLCKSQKGKKSGRKAAALKFRQTQMGWWIEVNAVRI